MVNRKNLPTMNPSPIITSQIAKTGRNNPMGRKGKVSRTSVSAGLAPGISFRAPNQKKTMPTEMRNKVKPFLAIQFTMIVSTSSNLMLNVFMFIIHTADSKFV